jgi:hypothetical protein
MWADSMARFTAAWTPGILFSDFSIVLTQEEQVIPVSDKLTCLVFRSLFPRLSAIGNRLLPLLLAD